MKELDFPPGSLRQTNTHQEKEKIPKFGLTESKIDTEEGFGHNV